MSDEELEHLFRGYGYKPYFVEGEGDDLYEAMAKTMDMAYRDIRKIWKAAREEGKVQKVAWPVILFRSLKGWTA